MMTPTNQIQTYPYYHFQSDQYGVKLEGRFWNCGGGTQVAIVASITRGVDWAAYVGADRSSREDDTLHHVAERGCKLSENDARYFFPGIDLPYRY